MLISIAMMFLVGMSMGWICKKIHLPSLFGMIVTGIVLGPYVLDVIDASILNISSDLRRIALIIILMRAGLSLDLNDLKKVGRPAVLMCFVPACFEIGGMVLLAPKLLGISILDAAIMGTVIAAVSPAVIVPKMLKLMEEGYGVKKSIPQMILAGASVDDVFVIVMFTAFTMKERMFCVIAYMPKATVQAAIGGVPLAMGLSCGNIVLTVAVTAILITAPLGAFLIEATYKKWLGRQTEILSR